MSFLDDLVKNIKNTGLAVTGRPEVVSRNFAQGPNNILRAAINYAEQRPLPAPQPVARPVDFGDRLQNSMALAGTPAGRVDDRRGREADRQLHSTPIGWMPPQPKPVPSHLPSISLPSFRQQGLPVNFPDYNHAPVFDIDRENEILNNTNVNNPRVPTNDLRRLLGY